MQLGYLTHVAGDRPAREVFRETIELAVTAEAHGFDSFWVAQHHGGALEGLLPSPLVLLGAVAARTSTLRLGTAVVAAPLEDPCRLAEDAATLDAVSGERVELGIGAGADADAAAALGHDHADRGQRCLEALDGLGRAFEGAGLGRAAAGPTIPLVPSAPGLRARLWWATSSRAGLDAAAARGVGWMSGRPPSREVVDDLRRFVHRSTEVSPRVAVVRPIHADGDVRATTDSWGDDPVLAAATALLVQTQPARAPLSAHVRTVVEVARRRRDSPLALAAASPAPLSRPIHP